MKMAVKLVVLCIAFLLFVASVAAIVERPQAKNVKITGKKHPLIRGGFFSRLLLDHAKVKPGFLMHGMRKAVASPNKPRAVNVEGSPKLRAANFGAALPNLPVIGRVSHKRTFGNT